ncbi:MAG: hypothetical protein ACRCW9_06135 [Cetobacterium sp.]
MQIIKGNIFELKLKNPHLYIGCTTNGVVNKDNKLVMGAGVALSFKLQYNNLDSTWGRKVKLIGNRVFLEQEEKIFSFPTKHNWKEKSDLELIKKSFLELKEIALSMWPEVFILPFPGIGLGGLNKSDIESVLKQIQLPENIYLIEKE